MEGWFQREISKVLGDGEKVSFWCAKWLGHESLRSKYPRLFLN